MGEIGDVPVTWKFANRGEVQSQVAHMCCDVRGSLQHLSEFV